MRNLISINSEYPRVSALIHKTYKVIQIDKGKPYLRELDSMGKKRIDKFPIPQTNLNKEPYLMGIRFYEKRGVGGLPTPRN